MIQAYEFAIEKIGLDYASHPVSCLGYFHCISLYLLSLGFTRVSYAISQSL